jgi:hypothetical protein
MSGKIGRNEPCPCGSGKKLKKCCGEASEVAGFGPGDRERAFHRLEGFVIDQLGAEDDDALEEFWGEWLDEAEELSNELDELSNAVLDCWVFFDRPLPDGRLVVDTVLAEDKSVGPGERAFLTAMRQSAMHLWEVEDVVPGVSLSLRDVIENTSVVVHERSASRIIGRREWLAARVIPRGASGAPEMERGVLHIPRLLHDSVRAQLLENRAEFLEHEPNAPLSEFYKTTPPFFHDVWVGAILAPAVPELQNTDGEPLLITEVNYEVLERDALKSSLDACPSLDAGANSEGQVSWRWLGENPHGDAVLLGKLTLHAGNLVLEANSAERARRGADLLESLAGSFIRHRATTHEDLTRRVREGVREQTLRGGGGSRPPDDAAESALPSEAAEALMLNHLARHYRAWLDDSIPALEGKTPREAAQSTRLRGKLVELIHGLEGQYEHALKNGEPAYDPSWMWAELGLADGARPPAPPPMAHERIAERVPGAAEVSLKVARARRQAPGFSEASTLLSQDDCQQNLELRRFLKAQQPAHIEAGGASEGSATLASYLALMVNFDLHLRKAFWVDEPLAFLLARTELDARGAELRAPFPALALVFTDRYVLSLAERLLSRDSSSPVAGHLLKIVTVYVVERGNDAERTLELTFALDALGADAPALLRYELELAADSQVQDQIDRLCPPIIVEPAIDDASPLRGLLTVALNAILYATSPGAEPETLAPPDTSTRRARSQFGQPQSFTSDEVYFLPGAIEISTLRGYQALERLPDGRQILHRSMVRGHWRRAPKNWTDQRMRWIAPYWKGPELAAIVERAYRLTQ